MLFAKALQVLVVVQHRCSLITEVVTQAVLRHREISIEDGFFGLDAVQNRAPVGVRSLDQFLDRCSF
ncbi:hypothetical protein L596_012990 [Steinernema carpocapsae]|uniref:Uncharacterized protein n=1 Tax=Steinernema carpocapsae TaxID=34508 RepID=A0A4U5NZN2_STECR|nr:hypothetical protein L596_012990 [Steinernema carpocapsae]